MIHNAMVKLENNTGIRIAGVAKGSAVMVYANPQLAATADLLELSALYRANGNKWPSRGLRRQYERAAAKVKDGMLT